MKHRLHFFAFLTFAVLIFATSCQKETLNGPLPKVHIIATGGTIAGKVSIETIFFLRSGK